MNNVASVCLLGSWWSRGLFRSLRHHHHHRRRRGAASSERERGGGSAATERECGGAPWVRCHHASGAHRAPCWGLRCHRHIRADKVDVTWTGGGFEPSCRRVQRPREVCAVARRATVSRSARSWCRRRPSTRAPHPIAAPPSRNRRLSRVCSPEHVGGPENILLSEAVCNLFCQAQHQGREAVSALPSGPLRRQRKSMDLTPHADGALPASATCAVHRRRPEAV